MRNNLNNISLKQLRAFEAITQQGSFIEAAHHLFLTPSALSETIKALESRLGVRLFDRSTRRVDLTPAGREFLEHTQQSLTLLENAVLRMDELRGLRRGRVRVVGATSAMACLVTPCLPALSLIAPQLRVEMRTSLSDSMLYALHQGEADFCVASIPAQALQDVEHTALLDDQFGLVGIKGHPALATPIIDLNDVLGTQRIGLTTPTLIDDVLADLPDLPAAFRDPLVSVDGTGSLVAVLEQGTSVAILPALSFHQLANPALVFRPLAPPFRMRRVSLARNAARSLTPAAQALWDLVLQQAQRLADVPGIYLPEHPSGLTVKSVGSQVTLP